MQHHQIAFGNHTFYVKREIGKDSFEVMYELNKCLTAISCLRVVLPVISPKTLCNRSFGSMLSEGEIVSFPHDGFILFCKFPHQIPPRYSRPPT